MVDNITKEKDEIFTLICRYCGDAYIITDKEVVQIKEEQNYDAESFCSVTCADANDADEEETDNDENIFDEDDEDDEDYIDIDEDDEDDDTSEDEDDN